MRLLAALLVSLALTGPARAERPLTLDEAIARARSANRDLKVARARVAQAAADVGAARARLLPSAAVQGRYTRNDQEVAFELGGASLTLQPLDQVSASETLTVPLVAPGAYPAVRAARHGENAAAATREATEAQVLLAVAEAYYAAAGTDELLAARREATAVTAQTLEDARTRRDAGAASAVEVTRAELAEVQAEQAVTEAEDGRAHAYRALATVIQLREPFTVAPGVREVPAPPPVDALVARALEVKPELRALREQARAAGAQVSASDWGWAPSLAAFGTATQSSTGGLTGQKDAWSAGLQLQWDVFDGGARLAQRRRAAAQRTEAELSLAIARDTLADAIADRARAVETKRSALAAAERAEGLAEETLATVRTQYAAGAVAQIELLQAQDALTAARVTRAQARFDLSVADLQLRERAGLFPGGGAGAR